MSICNVKIDDEVLVDILIDRLESMWTQDSRILDLYRSMYEMYVECDAFSNMGFDPAVIVDNDWINYTSVLRDDELSESDWKKICELGIGDCSCEDFDYGTISYIEGINEDSGLVLIRN